MWHLVLPVVHTVFWMKKGGGDCICNRAHGPMRTHPPTSETVPVEGPSNPSTAQWGPT